MFHPDDPTLTRHSRLRRDHAAAAGPTLDAAGAAAPAPVPARATGAAAQAAPSQTHPASVPRAAGAASRVAQGRTDLTRTGEAASV